MARYDLSAAYRGAGDPPRPGRGGDGDATGDADAGPRPPAKDPRPRPRDRYGRPRPRGEPDEMAHAEEPEEVAPTFDAAFARATALFDAGRFFEAHEFFEHIWKSDWVAPDERDLWKGVTQVAVGCCHVQRGNETGALALLDRAARYLAAGPARHRGVDVARLVDVARDIAAQTRERGASPELEFPRFPRSGEPERHGPR